MVLKDMRIFLAVLTYFASAIYSDAQAADSATVESFVKASKEKSLSESDAWRRLGHYTRDLIGWSSQVDGLNFFLHPNGVKDPEGELETTLRGFFDPKKYDESKNEMHPQCRFPARLKWIKNELPGLDAALPKVACPMLEDTRFKFQAKSATFIFSSFYLNNPSSAFGHTFLRLNSARSIGRDGEHHELLDFGINYSAVMTTQNIFLYSLLGATGGFRGTYTSVPYYYKVREYNDYEARDLWGYDLDLTPEEVERLVDHVWELGPTYFDYFYFTENCAYHLFSLLHVAAPRYNLNKELPFYVIPSDSARAVYRVPGLVKNITYRPSARSVFNIRLDGLDPAERELLAKVALDQDLSALTADVRKEQQARVLDAALDHFEYKYPDDALRPVEERAKWKRELLTRRAALGVKSAKLEIAPPQTLAPHLGHGIRRASLAGGYQNLLGPYISAGMRFALSDITDTGPGYPPNAQIEFTHIRARVYPTLPRLELEDLNFFRVTSLSPFSIYQREPSFRVEVGIKTIRDGGCDRCLAGVFEAGPGLAFQPGRSDVFTLFGFVDLQLAGGPGFYASKFRIGLGPTAGFTLRIGDAFRLMTRATYRALLFSSTLDQLDIGADARLELLRFWSIYLTGQGSHREIEGSLGTSFYF